MKVAFKSMVAAAAFIAAHTAFAATINVPVGSAVNGIKVASGTETLKLSPETVDFVNLFGGGGLAPVGAATLRTSAGSDAPQTLFSVDVALPLASVALDSTTLALQSTTGTGGYTHSVPVLRSVTTGGAITISDLSVDLAAKRVYATVVGANGVGTLSNYHLFDVGTVVGATSLPGAGTTTTTFTVSGLALTADASSKFITALGLSALGRAALGNVAQGGPAANFGSIDVTLTAAAAVLTPTCAVTHKVVATGRNTFTDTVTVNNNSSNTLANWTAAWDFSLPTLLSSIKNAKVTSATGLTSFQAQPLSTNKNILPGGAVSFSFRGTTRGGIPTVSKPSATAGGVACQAAQ